MLHKKIAVLRGGNDVLHDMSLKSGERIIDSLKDRYEIDDVVFGKNGQFYKNGYPTNKESAFKGCRLVFNALHGNCSEVQRVLEAFGIPYTGSGRLSNGLSLSKVQSKKIFSDNGIQTPHSKILIRIPKTNPEIMATEIFRTMPLPLVLKPIDSGSSMGVIFVKDFDSLALNIGRLFKENEKIMVEEFINGKEASVGVIENFRNHDIYTLIPVEIEKDGSILNYENKYTGSFSNKCPGSFTEREKDDLMETAKKAHSLLGLRHYSSSDFIIHPKRGVFVLETNALPPIHDDAVYPMGFSSVGATFDDFLEHLIEIVR